MNFFHKESQSNKKTKNKLEGRRGGGGARVSDFFFPKESKSEGMKVREDWLVYVILFYKESKSKKKKYIFVPFFFWRGGGGGWVGREGGGRGG